MVVIADARAHVRHRFVVGEGCWGLVSGTFGALPRRDDWGVLSVGDHLLAVATNDRSKPTELWRPR